MIHGLWSEDDDDDNDDDGQDAREVYKLIRAANQEAQERRREMVLLLVSILQQLMNVVLGLLNMFKEQRRGIIALQAHLQATQAVVATRCCKRRRVEKEWWVKPRLLECDKFVAGRMDQESSLQLFNMTPATFEWLCSRIAPLVHKSDTNFRSSIPPRQRIAIAIHRLAGGSSYLEVSKMFAVGEATVLTCTRQVYAALSSALGHLLAFPSGAALDRVMAGFLNTAGLPNCCGALGVVNFKIKRPSGPGGSGYLDNQGSFSIAAQLLVDCSMRLLNVAVGFPGGAEKMKILKQSALSDKAARRELLNGYPVRSQAAPEVDVHQYVVADSTDYNLLPWLMLPYTPEEEEADGCKSEFNSRLRQAGMVAGGAFEALRRWQVLDKAMNVDVHTAVELVVACAILHNVLLDREFAPPEDVDESQLLQQQIFNHQHQPDSDGWDVDAGKIRDSLAAATSTSNRWAWAI